MHRSLTATLPLSRYRIDRDDTRRARPSLFDEFASDPAARIIAVWRGEVLLAEGDAAAAPRLALLPWGAAPADALRVYLGRTLDAEADAMTLADNARGLQGTEVTRWLPTDGQGRHSAVLLCFGALVTTYDAAMAVPDWPPTRIMKKFFDEQYKPKSGNTVKLDVDFIPWPDFYTRVNASLTSGEQKYNFIVSDSQWLGAFVEGGYYRKINDLLDADPEFKKTLMSVHPAPLAAYSTYPYKSENYYGFPQFPDVLVNYARKDIICNEEEQKNFQAKYGKKLPCTGEELDAMTWDDFKNVGEFFRRKKGEMLAGKQRKAAV